MPDAPDLDGIWSSRYSYYSSSRGETFDSVCHVVVRSRGDAVEVESLPREEGGTVRMRLDRARSTVQGTWEEATSPTGYYEGAVYRGALQMVLTPSGRRMVGKWVGHGRDFEINTGGWELVFVTREIAPEALARYGHSATTADAR
jgi:hypothetical protein